MVSTLEDPYLHSIYLVNNIYITAIYKVYYKRLKNNTNKIHNEWPWEIHVLKTVDG